MGLWKSWNTESGTGAGTGTYKIKIGDVSVLKSVTNNYCSMKTFHPHIIFISCYYIFYCRNFCIRHKVFL